MASLQSHIFRLVVKHYIAKKLQAEVSLPEQRTGLERLEKLALASPFTKVNKLTIGECDAEWIKHKNARSSHAILYIHGGGFTTGSPSTHRLLAERLSASSRAAVLLLDYRLAPEFPYPAGLNDCVNAYQWLLQQGISQQNLAIAGDSAGGGLTLSTLLKLKEVFSPLPAAAVLYSPWVDLSMSGKSIENNKDKELMLSTDWMRLMAKHYSAGDTKTPMVSPLFGDLTDLPPILIQVDESEVLLDDAVRLAESLKEAGTPHQLKVWKGMWHVWQTFVKFVPEANAAVDESTDFILSHWKENL